MKTDKIRLAMAAIAAPLLALCAVSASTAAASDEVARPSAHAKPVSPYETKIGEAKASMMAAPAEALEHARQAGKLAKGNTREANIRKLSAQWLEGEALMRLNRADEAQQIIDEALSAIEAAAPGVKLHADLLRSQASLKASSGDYGEALSFFQDAHDRYEALGEARSQAIVLQNIGSLYSDARDYERVLSYYKQATQAFPEDKALSLSAHNNRGNALKELGRYDEAEEEFRLALGVAGDMGSPMLEARILTNIASTQFLNGQLAAAEQSVGQGIRLASSSAPDWLPFLYGVNAQIAFKRGDVGAARDYINRTFADQDLSATSPYFRDFHETAYKIGSETGDYRSAVEHLAAFNRLDGQARDLSAQANNALLGARFDATNRELRISKLSAEKLANEANLASAQNKVFMLSAGIGLAILACFVALVTVRTVNRSKAAISATNAKLTYVTQHDSLTGLFARDHFRHLLEREKQACVEAGETGVLMLIDLDRFKQVNDIYGHAVGDKLLAMVAERFREATGPDAFIGRLGGDEFSVFLPHPITLEDAQQVATRLIELVGKSYFIDNHEMSVGASVGIAAMGSDETSTSAIMTNADMALYEAKNRGRGTYVVYHSSMRSKIEERSNLQGDLSEALKAGELSISYQPIVDSNDHKVACYEALLRWEHPERGLVPPSVFIPIAEEALLIEQLGSWVLRKACSDAVNWPDDIKLTVNVSNHQLSSNSFLSTVVDALASSGLAPERLVLELTESIVLEMDEQVESLLVSLHELGVSLALDDFGQGYSSLNYIERMHFAMIKIDRDFVQSASAGTRKSKAIVTAIVSLARSLKIDVVAEGVESDEQAEVLAELGCTRFQGYHFGRPLPASECLGASQAEDERKVA